MKIISWNINGLRAATRAGLFKSIQELDADVICLQETKAQEGEVLKLLSTLAPYILLVNSAEKKGYSGTAILTIEQPWNSSNGMGITVHDREGRLQFAEYNNFYMVNIYAPNSGQKLDRLRYRKQWDADLLSYLKDLESTKPVVACGDFNVAHRAIDLTNGRANYNRTAGYTQVEIDGMENFIKSGFVDIFRYLHPQKVAYTFWSSRYRSRERNIGWRIDYFLVSPKLVGDIKSVAILSDYHGSDHCPICLELDL